MTRVLILSWEYPPLIEGGLARHVRKLSEGLTEQGVEVHVLTRGGEESPPEETVAGVAQRNYQRWRSVQDEIFKTLMNAAGRGGRDGEDKPTDTTSHQ